MHVAETVRALGGHISSKLSRSNTHLILPTTGGDKFDACAKLNVKPVTVDWLVDSAVAGASDARGPPHCRAQC